MSEVEATGDRRLWAVFALCVTVGVASGSNYVYSAYAPQLASQLSINSTTVNLIGLAGNLGMYASGPIWGRIIDARGPTLPLLAGGICCLTGYSTVRLYLLSILSLRPPSAPPESHPTLLRLLPLLIAMCLTGSGGSAGLSSAVNATAKSFPDSTRATASGAVLAGFGLSAFLFSTLGHAIFPGRADGLVGLLALGTGLPMLVGSIFIRPVPPTDTNIAGYQAVPTDGPDVPEIIITGESRASVDIYRTRSPSLELIRSRSPLSLPRSRPDHTPPAPETKSYHPVELARHPPFLALALVLGLLCGTGLMYINNVGLVALALAREGHIEYDKEAVGGWQARMVGLVSIWNCSGRILGGIVSDFAKTRYGVPRIAFLPVVSTLFIISQLTALATRHVSELWFVSSLLGGAYGALFNVMPMLVLEWFGIGHFSQNFGWICVAPVVGGNLFNLVFGRVYDAHAVGAVTDESPASDVVSDSLERLARALGRRDGGMSEGQHDCLVGEECYGAAFKVSTCACVLALLVSVGLAWHRTRAVRVGMT